MNENGPTCVSYRKGYNGGFGVGGVERQCWEHLSSVGLQMLLQTWASGFLELQGGVTGVPLCGVSSGSGLSCDSLYRMKQDH